ncbi:histone [Candidatus Woesearchaeota archaeon]|nr:histone [Candidatus Woesearchaeota archaeon]
MPKNKHPIPNTSAKKILEAAGAERVSKEAAAELAKTLEEIALDVAKKAAELAEHAGRKTILGKDVRLATRTK